ncbi:zinc-dependent alcohol dehydrogenase [Cellulosilyticum sp. I15G10I2]|uniref:zinc-dependent alcohol dehydrogenase n=1 Tax=Cellulosilyticum sp. I15G10I2 TaxID=1892843 RepID=UPI00085C12EC
MLQAVMAAPHEIEFKEIPVPEIKPEQVLVQIKRIGVCGSDMHVNHGQHPYVSYPLIQGHEVSAKIIALGKAVTGLQVGQKVTIEPQVYCGECYPCTHGKYNLCEDLKVMGFQTIGTASEYFAVDASKITPLPDGMSYDEGAMIEPLAVTVHACKRSGDVKDKKVVVLGAGPIGILLCQTLKAYGAAEVMMTDISDYRLDLAKRCGADYVYNTKHVDFAKVVVECFGKDKADIIYDCAGNDITMGQAIANARKGSIIVLLAVFAGMATVDLAKLNDSEVDLYTSMMYRHEDYLEAIRLVEEGKIQLKPLMSKHFDFKDYPEAYHYIDNNHETTMKVLIDVDGDEG